MGYNYPGRTGGRMNADAAACQCHLLDTPYGLKIFFQGRVQKNKLILLSLIASMTILSGLLLISGMLYKGIIFLDEDVFIYWATFTMILALLVYIIWNYLPIFMDQILIRDTITINAQHIYILKSGFLSLARYKEFPISCNRYFQVGDLYHENRIIFGESVSATQKYRSDFRLFSPSPMRSFCRGISPAEADAVINRIYQKYPLFDIHAYRDQLIGEDETDQPV
jgi:hypothetical protein